IRGFSRKVIGDKNGRSHWHQLLLIQREGLLKFYWAREEMSGNRSQGIPGLRVVQPHTLRDRDVQRGSRGEGWFLRRRGSRGRQERRRLVRHGVLLEKRGRAGIYARHLGLVR